MHNFIMTIHTTSTYFHGRGGGGGGGVGGGGGGGWRGREEREEAGAARLIVTKMGRNWRDSES